MYPEECSSGCPSFVAKHVRIAKMKKLGIKDWSGDHLISVRSRATVNLSTAETLFLLLLIMTCKEAFIWIWSISLDPQVTGKYMYNFADDFYNCGNA